MTEQNTTPPQPATPHIVYGEGVDSAVSVDEQALGQTMRELGVSEQGIANSAVYIDPKNRLQTFGTHYPNLLGRLRFITNPEVQKSKGDIVRLSTTVKGKPRSGEQMNRTLVHELEHLAQHDRHDPKVTEGHIAIWGLAAVGAIVGNRLGRKTKTKSLVGATLGAVLGHSLGYLIAPHEQQARNRAGQSRGRSAEVTSRAVSRKR